MSLLENLSCHVYDDEGEHVLYPQGVVFQFLRLDMVGNPRIRLIILPRKWGKGAPDIGGVF